MTNPAMARARISRRTMLQVALGAGIAAVAGPASLPVRMAEAAAGSSKKMIFAWLVASDPASFRSLRKHAHIITHVSPTWYSMDRDRVITGEADPAVVQLARGHGIALLPLIKNKGFSPAVAHDILANATRRTEAATRIADLVVTNAYDGINIDFEGPFGESRDRYSDFLRRLAALLRQAGKLLTVDVVPQLKPASDYQNTSWAAPYDYTAIAQSCDAVMLMCYSYSDRDPGPISPLWWLQDTTGYALAQIPPQKLVVGSPFYGRHWIVKHQKTTYSDVTQSEAEALLARSRARLERPALDATPRFTWKDAKGEHFVHFEDGKSLEAKLQVVRAAGVAGATFWRLGQENASQWKLIKNALAS